MPTSKEVVCFAPNDWWGMNPSCTTHYMLRLSKERRVLWVNPFGSDLLAGGRAGLRSGLAVRVRRKLGSLARFLKHPQENLYVFSPAFLPVQGRSSLDALNNAVLGAQIRTVCLALGFEKPVLWFENPRAADLMGRFSPCATVFHVSDLFASDTYTSASDRQREREARLSAECDLLICVSRALFELKLAARGNVHYVPHGVDYDLFRAAAQQGAVPEEISGVPRPIAGYFGTMTANNDIEMMEYCARRLPQVSFVFAGQITTGDYSVLRRLKNVYLLGRLAYERIPALCASFDVCMLQWRVTEWIRKCNPLKMLEYMASGRPIVSVEIEEAVQYADVISIAKTREEFCRAIQWELEHDTEQRRARRIQIASMHSWEAHTERITQLIDETVRRRKAQ